jgi:hypothetical protein
MAVVNSLQALSERELLVLHAETLALMDRYGLRYKDAAHRLFLSEIGRIQALDDAMTSAGDAVEALQSDMIKTLHPHDTAGTTSTLSPVEGRSAPSGSGANK